jgi:beta-galactosidase
MSGKSVKKLMISGFAPSGNTIQLKLNERVILLEFGKSSDYITQEFEVGELAGINDVSFVFLPGSDFNFEWFKFI